MPISWTWVSEASKLARGAHRAGLRYEDPILPLFHEHRTVLTKPVQGRGFIEGTIELAPTRGITLVIAVAAAGFLPWNWTHCSRLDSQVIDLAGETLRISFRVGAEHKAVAHPGFRQEVLRFGGISLQLFPQVIDEDAEVFHLVAIVGSPDGLQ